MKEVLLSEIINLEEQLQEIEQKKAGIDPNTLTNISRLEEITGEYNAISNRLNEKKYEMEKLQKEELRTQSQEQKIEQAKNVKSVTLDGVEVEIDPDIAELIGIISSEKLASVYQEHNEEIRGAEEREVQLKRQNDELQGKLKILTSDLTEALNRNSQLVIDLHKAVEEKEYAEQKRDNAVAQLEELQQQIEVNKSKVAIDIPVTERAKELMENIQKRYVSTKLISTNWVEAMDDQGNKEVLHIKDLPAIIPPMAFPVIEVLPQSSSVDQESVGSSADSEKVGEYFRDGSTVVEGSSSVGREAAGETVTRAEFEELKRAVDTLYVKQRAIEDHLVA